MDFDESPPAAIAAAIAAEIGREVDYRPVASDGAARAAALIAEVLYAAQDIRRYCTISGTSTQRGRVPPFRFPLCESPSLALLSLRLFGGRSCPLNRPLSPPPPTLDLNTSRSPDPPILTPLDLPFAPALPPAPLLPPLTNPPPLTFLPSPSSPLLPPLPHPPLHSPPPPPLSPPPLPS